MTFRVQGVRGPVAVAAGVMLAAACGGSQKPLPVCEQGSAALTARTADGAATIAAVDVTGNCHVSAVCVPSTTTPCASVSILGFSGLPCSFTFVSVDGRSVSATASLVANGPTYQCRDGTGMVQTAGYAHFEPAEIVVDFSMAPPADAGVD